MRGMTPGAAGARKRLGLGVGGGGFALGCGCRDAKAVAVAASSTASPYSATATTDTSTATTATTWRSRARTAALHHHHHPSSASGSTGTLSVPSASSSSFVWEDAEGDAGEEEVDCKQRESSAAAVSFSGLLRQLNELEQSVVTWGRKETGKGCSSPPAPPPPPPPPPPPLPARPKQRVVVHSGSDGKEGHGNFSPPPPSIQLQTTQHHRKAKNMDKADREAGEVRSKQPTPPGQPPPSQPLPLPPEQLKAQSTDKGGKKEDASIFPTRLAAALPKHRRAKSCDGGAVRLDGSVAVVKQSDDPLNDFRRSMVNMVVENRIATGDELRELLRHFLALNAPHHHDAILQAFTEIWDEAFSAAASKTPDREPAARRQTPPRPRPTPPRRRHAPTPRVWR